MRLSSYLTVYRPAAGDSLAFLRAYPAAYHQRNRMVQYMPEAGFATLTDAMSAQLDYAPVPKRPVPPPPDRFLLRNATKCAAVPLVALVVGMIVIRTCADPVWLPRFCVAVFFGFVLAALAASIYVAAYHHQFCRATHRPFWRPSKRELLVFALLLLDLLAITACASWAAGGNPLGCLSA